MNITAFFSYVFLTSITPGPNNIMAMTNSAKLGLRPGLRFCIGVFFGVLIVMSLCTVFTSVLFQYIPALTPVMKWIGAAYILFLAYTIYRDQPSGKGGKQYLNSSSVLTGMIMQFVNIKVILFGITVLSTFVLPHVQSIPILLCIILLLSFAGFACTCCWALFGSLFQKLFLTHAKILNIIMALLLVYCAVMSVL